MIDPIEELRAELAATKADLALLRTQLAAGMAVPDVTGQAGLALTNNGSTSSWAPFPATGVTSVGATWPITSTGGTTPAVGHATSGVVAGTYALATITVNAQGHVTSASSGSAAASWGSIGGVLSSQSDLWNALVARGQLAVANTWTGVQSFTGVAFGSVAAASPTDLTKHISLYSTTYGWSITSGRLNHLANGSHVFMCMGVDVATISSSGLSLTSALPISSGGTGATTAAAARNNLGLGSTTGALPVVNGGTGATTAAAARTNLGLAGRITVSNSPPSGGEDGDLWFQW